MEKSKLLANYAVNENGCWEWLGPRSGNGYGTAYYEKKNQLAHRLFYKLTIGEVPDGLVIDHLCRNRICVNPLHLEPVEQRINLLRGNTVTAMNASKNHCKWGHEFGGENLGIDKNGNRTCKTCKRNKDTEYNRKKGIKPLGSKTHCKWGHEFSKENTRYNKSGGRICRECSKNESKKRRESRKN